MAERENVVDFTVPYYDLVGISILMKKPEVCIILNLFNSIILLVLILSFIKRLLVFIMVISFKMCQVPTSLFKFLSVLEDSVW